MAVGGGRPFTDVSREGQHGRNGALENDAFFDAANSRPLTLKHPETGVPMVSFAWRGHVADLLTAAHELGHALQIVASPCDFVPPVIRELCAFIAELALLEALRTQDPPMHRLARATWIADNVRYIGRHRELLERALDDANSVYCYDWNYPIARILASDCFRTLPHAGQFQIFQNRISLGELVRFLNCEHRYSPSCDGACLAFLPVMQQGPELPVL